VGLERANSIRGLPGVNIVVLSEARIYVLTGGTKMQQILRFAQDDILVKKVVNQLFPAGPVAFRNSNLSKPNGKQLTATWLRGIPD
jgi:hypothetical protein